MRAELPTATVAEGDGLRTLHLGDTPSVQGAMLVVFAAAGQVTSDTGSQQSSP